MNVLLRTGLTLFALAVGWLLLWNLGQSAARAAPPAQSDPIIVTTPPSVTFSRLPTPTPSAPATPADAYRVRPGDTLLTIAVELDLDLADAHCLAMPDFAPDQPLVIGDLLTLLPPGERCHQVAAGETLTGVAATYATTPADLRAIAWNRLSPELSDITVLPPGHYLRVPEPPLAAEPAAGLEDPLLPMILRQPVGTSVSQLQSLDAALVSQGALPVGGPSNRADARAAPAPLPADWPYGSGFFAWPLYGWLTQDFHGSHRAIDVAAPAGTTVTAADRGASSAPAGATTATAI